MKKLSAVLLCLVLILCFAGCAGNTEKEEYGSNYSDATDDNSTGVKGYTGTIAKKWESVKDEYSDLEKQAKSEVDAMEGVKREEIETLVNEIETGVNELKNGITDETEETAKRVYKDAHKLELLAEKGSTDETRELKKLAKNAKALVKQYYGVADDDYDTVSEAVTGGLKKVRNFTDDMWNALIDLFK